MGIKFIKLLYDSRKLKNESDFQNKQYLINRALIIQCFDFLLTSIPKTKGCSGKKQHIFSLVFIENVPQDNNASELAMRNVKVKQKISE